MQPAPYAVPTHGFGTTNALRVNDLNVDLLARLGGAAREEQVIRVAAVMEGASASGFRLRVGDDALGNLSPADSSPYEELDWLLEAGLAPEIQVELKPADTTAAALLPPAGLCVPANNPPAQRWSLLEGTTAATLPQLHAKFSSELNPTLEHDCHFLVVLETKRGLWRPTVEAFIDGVKVGQLPDADSARLAPSIRRITSQGLVPVVRGYFTPGEAAPSLTVYADRLDASGKPLMALAGTAAATSLAVSVVSTARANAAQVTAISHGTAAAVGLQSAAVGLSVLTLGGAGTALYLGQPSPAEAPVAEVQASAVPGDLGSRGRLLSDAPSHPNLFAGDASRGGSGNAAREGDGSRADSRDGSRGVSVRSAADSSAGDSGRGSARGGDGADGGSDGAAIRAADESATTGAATANTAVNTAADTTAGSPRAAAATAAPAPTRGNGDGDAVPEVPISLLDPIFDAPTTSATPREPQPAPTTTVGQDRSAPDPVTTTPTTTVGQDRSAPEPVTTTAEPTPAGPTSARVVWGTAPDGSPTYTVVYE